MPELDLPAAAPAPSRWRAPALFFAFVAAVVVAAFVVGGRHRAMHGADFFSGAHLDARFQPPARLAGRRVERAYAFAWPLAQGSGSLRVRFETAAWPGGERLVTAVRVTPAPDLVDGVTATVRVTDYDTRTAGRDGALAPIGHVSLECREEAADGPHPHRVELRADGTLLDLDDPNAAPRRAE